MPRPPRSRTSRCSQFAFGIASWAVMAYWIAVLAVASDIRFGAIPMSLHSDTYAGSTSTSGTGHYFITPASLNASRTALVLIGATANFFNSVA